MPAPTVKAASTATAMLSHRGVQRAIFGVAFAILAAPDSVLVLGFGLAGSSGNSVVTAAMLTIPTLAVGLLCFRRDIVASPVDYLFLAFLLCIVSSFAVNGWTSNAKEYELLALSLAAYPACRFVSRADIVAGRRYFIWTTAIVVLLGTLATAVALWQQWDDDHGKPFVFGFDAAGTYFLGSLCFLVIALVTSGGLTMRRTALISLLIFLPMAIFAASMVRFTFIGLAGALCLVTILSEAKQRKYVVAVALVIFFAVAAGLLARYVHARIFEGYAVEQMSGDFEPGKPPSCYLKVNPRNSIAIRKVLVLDAVFLIPRAGWTGIGLDGFMHVSCIVMTEIHNSILQATVELGWLGGSLFFLMIVVAGGRIFFQAMHDNSSRFIVCSLAFVVLLSLAYGRTSRDSILFVFLGSAVALREPRRASAPASAASALVA